MYVNPDTGCYRVTDPDMALSSSLGPNDTLVLGGGADCPYLYGPYYGVAPLTPSKPQMLAQTPGFFMGASGNLCHHGQCINKLQLGHGPRRGLR